jgi:hypothetical protein
MCRSQSRRSGDPEADGPRALFFDLGPRLLREHVGHQERDLRPHHRGLKLETEIFVLLFEDRLTLGIDLGLPLGTARRRRGQTVAGRLQNFTAHLVEA